MPKPFEDVVLTKPESTILTLLLSGCPVDILHIKLDICRERMERSLSTLCRSMLETMTEPGETRHHFIAREFIRRQHEILRAQVLEYAATGLQPVASQVIIDETGAHRAFSATA
jgi:hypothetical protein